MPSWELFALQDEAYREATVSEADRWNAMWITNRTLQHAREWIANPEVRKYSLAADWDDRWRTGGSWDGWPEPLRKRELAKALRRLDMLFARSLQINDLIPASVSNFITWYPTLFRGYKLCTRIIKLETRHPARSSPPPVGLSQDAAGPSSSSA